MHIIPTINYNDIIVLLDKDDGVVKFEDGWFLDLSIGKVQSTQPVHKPLVGFIKMPMINAMGIYAASLQHTYVS